MTYDLESRTINFSKLMLKYLRGNKISLHNESIYRQVIRSATSIGANYREANGASSRKDFAYKIHICKKEVKETGYWLDLILDIDGNNDILQELISECKELNLIFGKIAASSH
ncbi:MAG: four helix bundle protein [Candidatus Dojkabacteria bacterium]